MPLIFMVVPETVLSYSVLSEITRFKLVVGNFLRKLADITLTCAPVSSKAYANTFAILIGM